ncbi:DUF6929 family protein [Sphingobacterium sp. LRF_L2]|uniref:DUF6929 family protein n=1 Tax=Sphingobacterium sp. LRF_L2 TaxID=3369421 RepID=UPI003F624C2C
MNEILLKILFTIHGIGAASGLLYKDNKLTLIADDSNLLYHYNFSNRHLDKQNLLNTAVSEQIPKKDKSDFEAITRIGNELYIFGSGSGENRNLLIKHKKKKVVPVQLKTIYQTLQTQFDVSPADFNIEGAIILKKENELWLFNRGNGPQEKNGIFILDKTSLRPKAFLPISLPKLQGISTGFTDATFWNKKIYFLAAAEDSNSNYHDGAIKGSILGILNPISHKIESISTISNTHKFEGISFYKKSNRTVEFLLCEDPDDGNPSSTIYYLQIPL